MAQYFNKFVILFAMSSVPLFCILVRKFIIIIMVPDETVHLSNRGLYLGNYHIHYGLGPRLMDSFRVARVGFFDLMILMETNIT